MLENLPRARSEKDITRVSGTLSTGSIPVGRTSYGYTLTDVFLAMRRHGKHVTHH